LGSFLHVPTIRQTRQQKQVDVTLIRERTEAIRADLDHALSSTIWNANFSVSVTFNCTECEAPIKRRVCVLKFGDDVQCGNCGQKFGVQPQDDGSFKFITLSYSWDCKVCGTFREIPAAKPRRVSMSVAHNAMTA
jgi:hypothetical protein